MSEVIVLILGVIIIVATAATAAFVIDRKVRHGNDIKIVCTVCRKVHWLKKTQVASWVMTGMRGDGRCDCGSIMKAMYLEHSYVQGVISRAHAQLYRNDAAEETIKGIQENLERVNRARLPQ